MYPERTTNRQTVYLLSTSTDSPAPLVVNDVSAVLESAMGDGHLELQILHSLRVDLRASQTSTCHEVRYLLGSDTHHLGELRLSKALLLFAIGFDAHTGVIASFDFRRLGATARCLECGHALKG